MNEEEEVKNNTGLIYMVVNNVNGKFDKEELISEAYIGLLNGIRSYKEELGKKSTYYTKCILNSVNKYIQYLTREKRNIFADCVSLNEIINEKNAELGEIISSDYSLENDVLEKFDKEYLYNNLEKLLTIREYRIISGLYFDGLTQMELAKEFGLSQTQIMNDKNKALNKLKYKLRR